MAITKVTSGQTTPVGTTPVVGATDIYTVGSEAKADELINPAVGQVGAITPVKQTTAKTDTASAPTSVTNSKIDATLSQPKLEETLGTLEAAQGKVTEDATVQGQLAKLQAGFQGGNTPSWAAGALRNADDAAAARGLGASSIATAARTQAAIESALPIAMQDAQTNAQMLFQNLNNKQQVIVQKNEARVNALLTDTAMQNAAKQFNAANENQVKQFNASLKTSVEQSNVAQVNAMNQFNAGEANALSKFMSEMETQRQQFNANNRLIIDQSNAEWRRSLTTTKNAEQNEANRLAATIRSNNTLAEYNNATQVRRDAINYAFTSAENAAERATQLLIANMSADEAEKNRNADSKNGLWGAIGSIAASFFG